MTFPLRFHVLLLPNVPWAEFRSRVIRLEELGFEVAGVADHLVDWTNPPAPWFEAWTSLAALAEATSRIRLTTLVTQIPLRNPAIISMTLAFVAGIIGSLVTREPAAEAKFDDEKLRTYLGIGAE